jgi:hypothetical protein
MLEQLLFRFSIAAGQQTQTIPDCVLFYSARHLSFSRCHILTQLKLFIKYSNGFCAKFELMTFLALR